MKIVPLLYLLIMLLSRVGFSQQAEPTKNDKMKAFEFLLGHWEGKGWISLGKNQIRHFQK